MAVPVRRPGPASLARYALGVGVTVVAVLSQYFVPETLSATRVVYDNLPGDLAVVYGIPVVAFAVLVGSGPLTDWARRMRRACWEGLRWYGSMSLLALLVVFALAIVYLVIDPSALGLLNRPNPALEQAKGDPWFFVGFSFVVGAFEETIFRGWIFGFWRDRSTSWIVPAVWTSVLFAGVHLYYGTTYGIAAPLIFPGLFLVGFAFAATFRWSGGNLVVIAVLHGAQDATAYLTIAPGVSPDLGPVLHYLIVFAGAIVALAVYLGRGTANGSAGVGPPPTTVL